MKDNYICRTCTTTDDRMKDNCCSKPDWHPYDEIRSKFYMDTYKEQIVNPDHYDRMIRLIMRHGAHPGDIDFATTVVNTCIRGAMDNMSDYAAGCCMALYTRLGKVRLFFEPLQDAY